MASRDAENDPRPQPPVQPQLEDCCGSGCVVCVFDAYEMAKERYLARLGAWRTRHPDAANSA
ncbi:MAG TPA: oxidoreductase-like domain-containing protein [Telluria sp.]|nr:oxidoreductase-like domain-containing protein [Telluria sp.]